MEKKILLNIVEEEIARFANRPFLLKKRHHRATPRIYISAVFYTFDKNHGQFLSNSSLDLISFFQEMALSFSLKIVAKSGLKKVKSSGHSAKKKWRCKARHCTSGATSLFKRTLITTPTVIPRGAIRCRLSM